MAVEACSCPGPLRGFIAGAARSRSKGRRSARRSRRSSPRAPGLRPPALRRRRRGCAASSTCTSTTTTCANWAGDARLAAGDTLIDRALDRRRCRCRTAPVDADELAAARPRCAGGPGRAAADPRGGAALQPAPDPARGRARRARQAQGRARAADRRRRARLVRSRSTSRRRGWARSGSSTSTSWTRPTSSARCSTARRTSAGRSSTRPRTASTTSTRTCRSRRTRRVSPPRTRSSSFRQLRRGRRRHRQLPDALPGERRVRAARQAERLRLDLPLRGAGDGVRARRTARATAASTRSRRRPGWCRRAPRAACSACCRASIGLHPGDRDDQADPRASASRSIGPPAAVRRAGR